MDIRQKMQCEIRDYLRDLIESGNLPEGAKLPSEQELAETFEVKRNWARQALRALAEEGYVLHARGRRSVVAPVSARRPTLHRNTAPALAIALRAYSDIFDRAIADAFMALFAHNYDVTTMLYNIRLDEPGQCAFLLKAPEIGIAGLAFWPQHDTPCVAEAIAALQRRKFPLVQVDRYVRGTETDFVVTDNEVMMHALTCRVIARGHTRIALAATAEDVSSVRDRRAGFLRALCEHNLLVHKNYLKTINDAISAHVATCELMGNREPPTAIVCMHDRLARSIFHELKQLDYRVPEHVELAAVDDKHFTKAPGFPMLSVRQQGAEVGRLAAELLLRRFTDTDAPLSQQKLPPDLEV